MKKKLEIIVLLKPRKRKEFRQTLNNLTVELQNNCSSLKINESDDGLTITILARWEKVDQMHKTLRSEDFRILSGAMSALSDRTLIWLDDKEIGNHISKLIKLK